MYATEHAGRPRLWARCDSLADNVTGRRTTHLHTPAAQRVAGPKAHLPWLS